LLVLNVSWLLGGCGFGVDGLRVMLVVCSCYFGVGLLCDVDVVVLSGSLGGVW